MRLTVCIFLGLLLAVPSFAQSDGRKIEKWTYIAWSQGDVVRTHFAPESIRRNEDIVSGWMRFDFPNGSSAVLPNTSFSSLRIFAVFDCAKGRAQSRKILSYDLSGRYIRSQEDDEWANEKPGTLSHAAFEYLCERRTSFPTGPPTLKPKT